MRLTTVLQGAALAALLSTGAGFAAPAPAGTSASPSAPIPTTANPLATNPAAEATPGATTPSGDDQPATAPATNTDSPALGATPPTDTTAAISPAPSATGGDPVTGLSDASTALSGASVQSSDGTKIGTVSKVVSDPGGQAQKVTVTLDKGGTISGKTLGLLASDLRFDSSNKIVVAQLTETELQALAAARTPGDTK